MDSTRLFFTQSGPPQNLLPYTNLVTASCRIVINHCWHECLCPHPPAHFCSATLTGGKVSCSVKVNIASGDVIEIGENTVIEGEVHPESSIKLSEGAGIYGLVDAKGAYLSMHACPQTQ